MSILFPRWTNALPAVVAVVGGGSATLVAAGVWYYFTPSYWEVGYEPNQPVDYSHQLHVGKLGMDCRYCHTHVEESPHANIPDTATCMSCHTGTEEEAYLNFDLWQAHKINENLVKVRLAYETGEPIAWRRVHKLPDYVYFNHAAHVNAGISCYSCHGRVDQLEVVRQVENLSMGWCLDCHRAPEGHLVDTRGVLGTGAVPVTDLRLVADSLSREDQHERGLMLARDRRLEAPENCGACHY